MAVGNTRTLQRMIRLTGDGVCDVDEDECEHGAEQRARLDGRTRREHGMVAVVWLPRKPLPQSSQRRRLLSIITANACLAALESTPAERHTA